MRWITQLFARRRLYDDLAEEIRQHLDEKVDALVQEGLSPEEARRTAWREFGNPTLVEERGREAWRWPALESVVADTRYALRQFRRDPTFAAVAVVVLGLGIGANTAVFSILDRLLLQPLPFHAPDRIAWVINRDTPALSGRTSTVATFEALSAMRSFEEITTYEAFFARSSYKLTGDQEPDRVAGVMVPANFFPFLGVQPTLGRTFTEEECLENGPGAVILSHGLWERRYASDPTVIGRQLIVNDRPATIVGVMPASFDFGAVFAPGIRIEIYMPVMLDVVRTWGNTLAILGRLAPGVTLEAAQIEANAVIERQQRERPEYGQPGSYGAVLKPFQESVIGGMRRPMLTLSAAVGLVLLIVCVNLSNLMLARGAARRKEMALRSAIGAGRARLARQLLTESLVLSAVGGALGVALAYAAVEYVRRLEGLSIPLLKTVQIDAAALAAAVGFTVLTSLLFGMAPAITAARKDLISALNSTGRGAGDGPQRFVRSSLVVSEVALACLLLVAAGLLLRSFLHVLDVNLGFQAERTYALRIDAGREIDSADKFRAYMRQLVSGAREVPGVEAASITDAVPLDSNRSWFVRGKDQPPEQGVGALIKVIGPGLMETMRTPLIAGREFTDHDDGNGAPVALINQSLAERLWPGEDALLRQLRVGNADLQIVGIVADVRHLSVEEPSGPEFYLPILQRGSSSPSLVVRTSRPFADVAPGLRAALDEAAPGLPTAGFRPLQQLVDRALSPRRFFVSLLIAFAVAAVVLAATGIYGVIAYSVARRTPEIGIRMALGASSARILSSVVGDTARLALGGIALGTVAAIPLSSVLASLLFGVSPHDPWTYGAAAAIVLLVALVAGFMPAFRASRITPMAALRSE